MRQVLNPAHLPRSLAAATLVSMACTPALLVRLPPPLAFSQALALWCLCLLMWQICQGWTPDCWRGRGAWKGRRFRWVVSLMVLITVAHLVVLDSWLAGRIPGFRPEDLQTYLATLPWVGLFQPLFLIATPYAFGWRLTRNERAGIALVIVFSQCIGVAQAWQYGSWPMTAVALGAGLRSALLVIAYRETGIGGVSLLAALYYSRHVPSLFIGGS